LTLLKASSRQISDLKLPEPMKAKWLIALILVLIGTNLFTFATSRYWTTRHVLKRAEEGVIAVMERQEIVAASPDDNPYAEIPRAVRGAGGIYYWWNDGVIHWGAGVVLILSGIAATRYQPGTKVTDSSRSQDE
jgi:hypothetical protein